MEAKSFREQLLAIRTQVAEAENEREQRKKEERERTKEKLAEELKQNPPERLLQQLKAIEENYKGAGKRFYPVEAIQGCIQELDNLEELLKRYLRYQERYPDIYSESVRRGLKQLKQGIADLLEKIQPQWDQWASVANLLGAAEFRQRQKGEEARLVEVAKAFHKRAHGIELNIPKSLFVAKKDNFHVVAAGEEVLGYFEAFPEEKRVSFAVAPPQGVNFTKLIRGIVHQFCTKGPASLPKDEIRVRVYSREEVKFYTELGFIRAETLGMSDWLYQRKV